MSAVIEFGFDSSAVFDGVDRLDRRLQKMDASVIAAQSKLAQALRNPWVSAGVDVQKYGAELQRAEKQSRLLAAQTAKMAAMQITGVNHKAAVNPWSGLSKAGEEDYRRREKQTAEAAAAMEAQQRAAEAAATAQQRVAAANAATQQRAAAAAAETAALAAAEQRKGALQANNGRMNLALLEAQLAGNKKEAASIEARIALMERMRNIQARTNVTQREAYTLAQRSTGKEGFFSGGGMGGSGGAKLGIGMAAMQMQDIAVQMQMGTKMSTIIAQQGSQLLSVFGPSGMLLGGLVAVGGMFYTMQEKGVEALKALKDEALGFDDNLRKLKASGISEMIEGMEEMKKKAAEMGEAAQPGSGVGSSIMRFFSPSRFDAGNNKWVNSADEKRSVSADLQAKNEQGRADLMKQIVQSSEEELRIANLRASGHTTEANTLEREVKLRRTLAQLEAAPEEVRGKLQANAEAMAQAEAAAEASKERQKTADAEERLAELKHKSGLEEMSLAQRIATIRVEMQRAAAEEARLRGAEGADEMKIVQAETKKVELMREISQLQKQLATEKEREFEAAKRTAEQEQREAEMMQRKASDRRNTVMDTALEYKLLQAKARGNERAVEEVEREQRVLERSRQLEEQNGLSKQEALALAIKMTDLEDRANGKPGKIHAPVDTSDPEGRNGLSGRSGPLSSRTGPLSEGAPLSRNGGLEGFWDLQEGRTGMANTPSQRYMEDMFGEGQSINEHHKRNAEEQAGAGNEGDNALVDSFLEKLMSRLPEALANAILTKS